MKKKILATTLTTVIATGLIAGNTAVSTFAYSGGNVQKVEVKEQQQQSENKNTNSVSKSSSQDMNNKKAVEVAKKAIEEKFKVSLDGLNSTATFTEREDMEGTFYFVTFVNSLSQQDGGKNIDFYFAFVNSKTGEIVSAMKNPTNSESVDNYKSVIKR